MPKRKTRRSHKQKRKTQRGRGRLVLQNYTSIFRPPLKCKDGTNTPYKSNAYIGKLLWQDTRERTTSIMQILQFIDPAGLYTIPPVAYCELAPEQENKNAQNNTYKKGKYKFQEIQRYGGISLGSRFRAKEPLKDILLPLEVFFPNLDRFNTHYVHTDLHPNNLIWDGTVYKMIDFDYISSKNTIQDEIQSELEMVHKNNMPSNENARKELDIHVDLYMKNYDLYTLTSDILYTIGENYTDAFSQEILQHFQAVPLIPDYLILTHELKNYKSAWDWLFTKLKSAN